MATQAHSAAMAADIPAKKTVIGSTICRILMGLMFSFFGSFGLLMALHAFTPPPTPMPQGAMDFNMALAKTSYMMPLVSGTQLVVGILLLCNRFVPLALTLLAPILVNILFFHVFLQPAGIVPGVVATALELYLAWSYRESFRGVLTPRAVAA